MGDGREKEDAMRLESEAVVWFVIGAAVVLLAELVIALLVLRRKPRARRALLGHAVCLLLAVACVAYLLWNRRVAPDGGTYNGSGLLALAGVFWFAAECFVIGALTEK